MKQDQVRVLRVIEYVGDRDAVEKTVAGSIHGEKTVEYGENTFILGRRTIGGRLTIKAATIGTYPELLEVAQPEQEVTK